MPEFEITYKVKRQKSYLTDKVKLMAIGETHARAKFYAWAKTSLKKFATIIYLRVI